ncbi:hypothetical protein [Phytohabitans rumicis]|uniref:Uncharacterized protein n=1 Tax=Phytohabitans rumicis TaxID=1076125 RepID=A0A6V8LHF3_9ACTN|nr:hypothetical protein [Phytohabitans rumicis]GFJ95664.1 hypothetical protein Prum_093060 [Phytohabitans rumicis]
MTTYGCARCYGEDAAATAAYLQGGGLVTDQTVVDDSHFIVSLRHCAACAQAFVSILTEFVDWTGGDDAQYRDIVPVTPEEAATVRAQGERVDLRFLGSLGAGRRRLSSDWPTGGGRRLAWRTGEFWVREGH